MRTAFLTIALALVLLSVPTALAHKRVAIGDDYQAIIGWSTEPAIVDQPNAVWVKIQEKPFGSPELQPGETYRFTFKEAGTFTYHCHPHPFMIGNITVEEAEGEEGHEEHGHGGHGAHAEGTTHQVTITDQGFTPENLTIHEGDTVVWTNTGSQMHQLKLGLHGEGHGHGDHDHGAEPAPVSGLASKLSVKLSIGGKETTLQFREKHGEPGVYVADVIPTVPGVYTATFDGTVKGAPFDTSLDLQEVVPPSAQAFPEKTTTLYELQQQVEALQAKQKAQAETPADVTPQRNPVPAPGLLAGLFALAFVAVALRRRK